jgi:hypothetical protein
MAMDEENRCNVKYTGKYNILPSMPTSLTQPLLTG